MARLAHFIHVPEELICEPTDLINISYVPYYLSGSFTQGDRFVVVVSTSLKLEDMTSVPEVLKDEQLQEKAESLGLGIVGLGLAASINQYRGENIASYYPTTEEVKQIEGITVIGKASPEAQKYVLDTRLEPGQSELQALVTAEWLGRRLLNQKGKTRPPGVRLHYVAEPGEGRTKLIDTLQKEFRKYGECVDRIYVASPSNIPALFRGDHKVTIIRRD